jgi:hypothetical protein
MIAFAACGILAALVLQSRAGGDEADAIIAKAIKAHLPKGIDDKKAYEGKNKGTLSIQGLELEFTQNIWTHGGKFKEVMELTVMNTPVKTITVYNGKEGWIKVNDMDIPVKDELLDEFKEMAYMMGIAQMVGLKEKGAKLSIVGEFKVNDKPAVGVKISKEGKKDIDLFFDKDSGLLVKTRRVARDFQTNQEVTEERIITAYQDVAGRKMPKKVAVMRDDKKLLEAEIVEARLLERLDDSEFAKP